MYIYSVTISIDKNLVEEWLKWMKSKHIPDVMKTGCFTDYAIFQVFSSNSEEIATFNIQYHFNKIEDLEKYQKEYASALQKEHKDRYEGKFVAVRTVLKKLDKE